MKNHMSHSEFLQKKDSLIQIVAEAMETVLIDMGEDIKGVSWFCSSADGHIAKKYDVAA